MRLRLVGGMIVALAAYAVIAALPDIKRYIRMRNM
jgi:NaMN:DMB phosphoribosyltransferase